jgi:hypothetical protein
MASLIKSTSSTGELPGYKVIQGIEALYVEGFRTPGEAMEGLKAAAAEKGANAIINVRHERTVNRCAAAGDAVLAETTGQVYQPPQERIEIVPPPRTEKAPERDSGREGDGPMIR